MMRRLFSVGLLALVSVVARAEEPVLLKVEPSRSQINYTVEHALHTVVATSQKVEGKVRLLPGGAMQVLVRAPVASFDSKNSGRDEHMQETMEVTKYPYVIFQGTTTLTVPTTFPSTVKLALPGELEFHGRKQQETVPVEVTFTSPTEARVVSKFAVSLEKYEVERPSLMLMKIKDSCQIALDLLLKQ